MHTAKIFKNGRSQAVRLPKEFRLEGDEVYVNKVGRTVILFPKQDSWAPFFESLSRFSEDFMTEREQPPLEQRPF
jgi:antitoxin VapB